MVHIGYINRGSRITHWADKSNFVRLQLHPQHNLAVPGAEDKLTTWLVIGGLRV